MENTSLAGKVIVITGASSGAGRAIAEELAAHEATLVLASRNAEKLNEIVESCILLGGKATAVVTDMRDYESVNRLAAEAEKTYGKTDVWINNAGVLAAGEFDHTPMAIHENVIRTNLLGYIHGAYAILPYFKKQNGGILINNISIGGFLPVPYGSAYSSSKFGLRGFSEALQGELFSWKNIHVCDLFPAFLDTPGIKHAANYTGKVLKPAPPVYDPKRVAQAVYQLILHPKPGTYIGSASVILKAAHNLFPKLVTKATALVMKTYFKQAGRLEPGSGNVLDTVDTDFDIYGGNGLPGKPKVYRKYILGAAVGVAASLLFLARQNRTSK